MNNDKHFLSQSRKFNTFFVNFFYFGCWYHLYKHTTKRNKIIVSLLLITSFNAGMQAVNSCSTHNRALVHQLLNTVQSLPPIKRRAVFAVVGAAVADAAIRPFHWVYDRPTLQAVIGDNVRPICLSQSMIFTYHVITRTTALPGVLAYECVSLLWYPYRPSVLLQRHRADHATVSTRKEVRKIVESVVQKLDSSVVLMSIWYLPQ
jgi:hypothetical protein